MKRAMGLPTLSLWIALVGILPFQSSLADTELNQDLEQMEGLRKEVNEFQKNTPSCQPNSQNKCRLLYSTLFAKPTLNIVFALGYEDNDIGPGNWSDAEYADFTQAITKPCPSDTKTACGFKRGEDDASLFTKRIVVNGVSKIVMLRAVKGSTFKKATDPVQLQRSQGARQVFIQGLKTADVVFYDGHSRDGGGPDFYPARRLPNGHIDYPWYRANRPGITDVDRALAQRENPLPVLAMFSCLSRLHYLRNLTVHTPGTALILTNRETDADEGVPSILSTLDSLFKSKCAGEMRRTRPNDSLEYFNFD